MAGTAAHALDVARSQLGHGEHPDGSNCQEYSSYFHQGCEAWCACWVCWVLGHSDSLDVSMSAGAENLYQNFKRAKRVGSVGKPGAVGFLIYPGDSIRHHTFMVESVRGPDEYVCLGGNESDLVRRSVRRGINKFGFGYPKYAAVAAHPAKPTAHKPAATHTQIIRRGSTGSLVVELQAKLNAHGARLRKDGVFGPKTEAAVIAYQRSHHLRVDGIVGPQTWRSLG